MHEPDADFEPGAVKINPVGSEKDLTAAMEKFVPIAVSFGAELNEPCIIVNGWPHLATPAYIT